MKQKKEVKEITLKLKYIKSKTDKEKGIYQGGVELPAYLDEISFDITDDYDFNTETEEFIKNGMFAVEIQGTKRALKEMGKFLINMAMYKTEDVNYHEHIDSVKNSEGNPAVNIIVRTFAAN